MKKSLILSAVCTCLFTVFSITSEAAVVTMQYNGPNFTFALSPLTTSDNVSGSVTFDDSFLDSLGYGTLSASNIFPDPNLLSASFSSGPVSMDMTGQSYNVVMRFVQGELFDWDIWFDDNVKSNAILTSADFLDRLSDKVDLDTTVGSDDGFVDIDCFSCGTIYWSTVVPIPAAIWLFGSGLLGLVGIARYKKS